MSAEPTAAPRLRPRWLAWVAVPAAALFLAFGPKGPKDQEIQLRSRTPVSGWRVTLRDSDGDALREAHVRGAPRGTSASYRFRAPDGMYAVHVEEDDAASGLPPRTLDRRIKLEGTAVVLYLESQGANEPPREAIPPHHDRE